MSSYKFGGLAGSVGIEYESIFHGTPTVYVTNCGILLYGTFKVGLIPTWDPGLAKKRGWWKRPCGRNTGGWRQRQTRQIGQRCEL
jgi:hypothetical protein